MKIVIFGAAGGLGRQLVAQALAAGHEVTAFVRGEAGDVPTGVRTVVGDVLDAVAVAGAVVGQEAVIDAIGVRTPWKRTGLEPDAARNIVLAMQAHGVRRLIVTSALGVGDSRAVAGSFYDYVLLPTFLRGSTKDKADMEADIAHATDIDWTVVRPAVLTDGEATGQVRVFPPDGKQTVHKIARADVAAFMVAQLGSDAYAGQAVTIATS